MWQSRTKPSFDDAYLPHRQGPTWAMRPPTSPSSRRENSARHDKACAQAAPAGNTTYHPLPQRQGPTWAMRLPTSSLSRQENSTRHDKACTHIALAGNTNTPPPPTRPDMDDEIAHLIVQPSGENSARHDKTRAHAARTAKETYHHRQQ